MKNARAITGDAYNLPIADNSQDVVFAFRATPLSSTSCTKESLTRVYSEILRVLKPDGEFVLYPQPRAEIRSFDPSASMFKVLKRTEFPGGVHEDEPSYLLFLGKIRK